MKKFQKEKNQNPNYENLFKLENFINTFSKVLTSIQPGNTTQTKYDEQIGIPNKFIM